MSVQEIARVESQTAIVCANAAVVCRRAD